MRQLIRLQQNSPSNNNQQNTSLLNNKDVSNIVDSISSDDSSHRNSAGGDSGAVASSSGNSGGGNTPASSVNSNPINSLFSSGSSPSSSGNDAPVVNNQAQKKDINAIKSSISTQFPGATNIKVEDQGDTFDVTYKDSSGTHKVKVDAYSGQIIGNVK